MHMDAFLFLVSSLTAVPATPPSSQPTTRPVSRSVVEHLIAELGSPDFKTREAAHRRLAEMGDEVNAELVKHVTDANEEIATRIVALLGKPKDPALRVELAVRLLSTADPDWMEKGVYLLFDSPREILDLYQSRTKDARGVERVIHDIVGEQLRTWKRNDDVFQKNYLRIQRKNPAAAERLRQSQGESNYYDAEAAYWSVVDAVADYHDPDLGERRATTRPTSAPR